MLDPLDPRETMSVERLKLAAWLILNGQRLLERRLKPDGTVTYVFRRSDDVELLVARWDQKTTAEDVLSKFSSIVSFEIRKAIRMRREAGISTRLRSINKS